jgi:ABC-type uncharacterized transport system permease subunit
VATSALVLVVALYAAAAAAYAEARRHREPPPAWARLGGILGGGVHLAGLLLLAGAMGRSPFSNSSQALSFLAFALIGLYLVLEATSRVASHGAGFFALGALLSALAVPGLIAVPPDQVHPPRDPLRTVHVGLALLATASVLAGGLLAIGYLEAYRRVKAGRLGHGAEGPSLKGFERLARRASLLGVLLLTPALSLGVATAAGPDVSAATVALVASTAVVLALVLSAGWIWWRRPLRGRLAAWLNLAGTGVVVVAVGLVHPLAAGWRW